MTEFYNAKELCNCKICSFNYGCPLKNTRFEEMTVKWGYIPLQMCNMAKSGLIIQGLERYSAYIMRLTHADLLETYLKYFIENKDILDYEAIGHDYIKLFIMLHHEEKDLKKILEFIPEPYRAYKDSFFDEYGRVKEDLIAEF